MFSATDAELGAISGSGLGACALGQQEIGQQFFGEEGTSQWVQSNLPVPGPAVIVCDSSKGKKKDKFASLKPLQTWNFLPPRSVLVLDMAMASPASQLQQFGSSLAAV